MIEMGNQFEKSYFNSEIMDEKRALTREGYVRIVKKIVLEMPHNHKILDVGCGRGAYLKDVHKLRPDLELYGVDIGDVEEYLPDYINFKKSSGDNLPFENEKFDLIICFHVLEHVLNPYEFLKEFHRVLKNDGFVYIEMPYYKTTSIPDGNLNFWSDPTHIKPYTYRSVERMLKESGFEVVEIKIWRSWITILLGPYLILKRFLMNDYDALSTFFAHLFGHSIGGLGRKSCQKSD